MEALLGFLVAGFALAGSPGPNTLSIAASGAAFGYRRSIAFVVGIAVGMVAVMVITATGVAGLVLAIPGATPVVLIAAALYFVYLAYRIATAPPLQADTAEHREPSLGAGFFQSLVNPKGYAAMAAMFSGFVLLPGRQDLDIVAKIAVLTGVIITVNIVWLVGGAALTQHMREPRTSRIINITFAALLLASLAAPLLF